jgi:predicted NAD/FAD-binding protein
VRRLPHGQRVGKVLASFPYYRATITIHTDPAFVAADRRFWSFDNVEVANGWGQGSLWYGAVHPPLADGSTIDIFKSWTTNRGREPESPIYSERFLHALPSPDLGRAQVALDRFQGRHSVWFVGSHCIEVDSQDTALRSAMRVADVLAPTSRHYATLKASIGA